MLGHFEELRFVQVCPVACNPVDPNNVEIQEVLGSKAIGVRR
jgi:hypothetical protein